MIQIFVGNNNLLDGVVIRLDISYVTQNYQNQLFISIKFIIESNSIYLLIQLMKILSNSLKNT